MEKKKKYLPPKLAVVLYSQQDAVKTSGDSGNSDPAASDRQWVMDCFES